MLGVSVHLLRVYEIEGLILSERTETNRRLYSDLEIEKVRCIRHMINDSGMNFEGIRRMLALVPCWRLRGCEEKDRKGCDAIRSHDRPCWATEEKCAHPLENCRECEVYRAVVHCNDLKEIIFGN
ncbi:MAG: MerR family transcriptional regulator [Calditrichia bacterium]|nr:MerR family transcriptional regulator [Calditrichia bacterium]